MKDQRLLVLCLTTILVSGVLSFLALPRMEDPVLSERAALVFTRAPGDSAERVEALITDRLAKALREFDEVKEVRSDSRAGVSTIAVTLEDEIVDVDEVWARVRDKISDVRTSLPPEALAPQFEIVPVRAYATILGVVWTGEGAPVYSILKRTARELEDAVRNVPDTETVKLFGEPEEEIVVEVDQTQLAKMGLTVSELSAQVAGSDVKAPAGLLRTPQQDLLIEIGGEFDSLQRIGRVPIVSQATGETGYLSDIATLSKGVAQPARSEALVDGQTAILVAASVLPKARIDAWNVALEQRLEAFRGRLPGDVDIRTVFSQSPYVSARINYLVRDLVFSAGAVVAAVFVMMGWRSACVVGMALPLSSCVVFGLFRVLEVPLHQMSLSGLVIALGMLEGTAIIIVDEVQRRIREGESRLEAVQHGVSHMALPLFGSAITSMLSFFPIATMPGPSGEFVSAIGLSVILALCSSLALSFTVLPALSAVTTPKRVPPPSLWATGFSWKWLARVYAGSLRFFFARPLLTVVLGAAVSLPGFALLPQMPVQFFPSADRDQFQVEIELSPQASMAQTRATARVAREVLLEDPAIRQVDWVLGRSAPAFYYNMIGAIQDVPNYAQALVRTASLNDLEGTIRRAQQRLDERVTTAQVRVRPLEQGPPFAAPIELRVFGEDQRAIREYGERVRALAHAMPDVVHTQADLTNMQPKLVYHVDESEATLVGLPLTSIAQQLESSLEGSLGGSVLEGNEELPVRVRVSGSQRRQLSEIERIDLLPGATDQGRTAVTLASLSTATLSAEPALISRLNGERLNEVRVFLKAGVLPSTVLNPILAELAKPENAPPAGCRVALGGEDAKRTEALAQLLGNMFLLGAGIAMVLVFSLKSFRAMFAILAIGLFSLGMAVTSLWTMGFAFGFTAILGAMGMVGIAINDSIVVLAELRADPVARRGDLEQMIEVVMRATRHVLCTTITVGCSFIAMLMEGGTFWPPMAWVISGGVFGATALALYWIPAVHILMARGLRGPLLSGTAGAS